MRRRKAAFSLLLVGCVSLSMISAPSASARSWVQVGSSCSSGGVAGWSQYTRCWGKKKLQDDGDSYRDYFSLRMTISANAIDGEWLQRTWVEPFPSASSAMQQWEGADPFQPDHTVSSSSDCTEHTWTVGGGNIPLSYSTTSSTCKSESFGPKLYSDPGHHAGIWSVSGNCVAEGVVRKAHASVSVRVPQGQTAGWNVTRYGAGARDVQSSC